MGIVAIYVLRCLKKFNRFGAETLPVERPWWPVYPSFIFDLNCFKEIDKDLQILFDVHCPYSCSFTCSFSLQKQKKYCIIIFGSVIARNFYFFETFQKYFLKWLSGVAVSLFRYCCVLTTRAGRET